MKKAQQSNISDLALLETFTGVLLVIHVVYLLSLPFIDINEILLFTVAGIVSFPVAYGLWKGENWAWWVKIILSVIGIIVFWPNIGLLIPESWGLLHHTAYLGYHGVIIFYLMKSHVRAFFNVQVVSESHPKVAHNRLPFIDFTRGIVMVLMAWDHANHFWTHRQGSEGLMGWRPRFPNFSQFLLRFITHYCAPIFIFLAGTALALSTSKRIARGESQKDISLRMIKRGAILLFLEAFVVAPAFDSPSLYFGVIACIGVCFMIFSVLRRLPSVPIFVISLLIILGHPFLSLEWIPRNTPVGWYLRVIIHDASWDWYPYVGLYPIIPWLGVMGLGWCFGTFLCSFDWTQIKKLTFPIVGVGGVAIILWFVVRLVNGYGNLLPRLGYTNNEIQDWLYMAKYPPSLVYLLWTLGGMCFFLALGLFLQDRPNFTSGITGVILTFGRVPLFFYCIHLWLYRLWPGWFEIERPDIYLGTTVTMMFWIVGLVILWRLCIVYEQLKHTYPDSLLQYL